MPQPPSTNPVSRPTRRAFAFACATLLISIAATCTDATEPVDQSQIVRTMAAVRELRLEALGASAEIGVHSENGLGATQGIYQWLSRSPAIVRVDDGGRVVAVANGATYVVVEESGGTKDSVHVLVEQRAAELTLTPPAFEIEEGSTQRFTATVRDALGNDVVGAVATWSVLGESTISVDGMLTAGLVGLDTVVARVGDLEARAIVNVLPLPNLLLGPDVGVLIGAGQYVMVNAVASRGYDPELTLNFSSSDASIVSVTGSVVLRRVDVTEIEVRGLRAGQARVVISAAGHRPDTLNVTVTTPHVLLRQPYDSRPDSLAVFGWRRVNASVGDSTGVVHPPLASTVVTLTVRDPEILRTDSVSVTIPARARESGIFNVYPMAHGWTSVTGAAQGHVFHSRFYTVVTPKLRFSDHHIDIGLGQTAGTQARIVSVPDLRDVNVPVTFTQKHPERMQFPDTASIRIGYDRVWFGFTPLALGSDTVIASAEGYLPDTLVIAVNTPKLIVSYDYLPTSRVIAPGFVVTPWVVTADSLGTSWWNREDVTIYVTSSDTSVLRPDSAAYRIPYGLTYEDAIAVRAVGTGMAYLTITESTGVFRPHVGPVITVQTPAAPGPADGASSSQPSSPVLRRRW